MSALLHEKLDVYSIVSMLTKWARHHHEVREESCVYLGDAVQSDYDYDNDNGNDKDRDGDKGYELLLPWDPLTERASCHTLLYMKTAMLSIRLDDNLQALLDQASQRSHKSRSEVAREALRRQLRISQFESLRRQVVPYAEAAGYLTDDDLFNEVS